MIIPGALISSEDSLQTLVHAIDSVGKSLQFRLDEDASGEPPMEDMVRVEIEEELDRMSRLRDSLGDEAKGGRVVLLRFAEEHKDTLLNALNFYEKRLENSMKATILKEPYNPEFKRTRRELELVKSVRQLLA